MQSLLTADCKVGLIGAYDVSEAKRLRELEKENTELKKMVAEQALDIRMLKDVNAKKW